MKQQTLFKAQSNAKAHGGQHSINKRRSKRPLNTKQALHVTLRSEFARGHRSLIKNKNHINFVIKKAANLFNIRVYEKAICGNHLHLLIKGSKKSQIQNFFRVVAGHVAQEILRKFPLTKTEEEENGGGAPKNSKKSTEKKKSCKKNQRKFWQLLIYSRIVSWGKEFNIVSRYILQNTLEALNIIAYQPRRTERKKRYNSS